MQKLFDSKTTNGRSSSVSSGQAAPPGPTYKQAGERKLLFSGAIGAATISIDTSPDDGTTWIASGATFVSGTLNPVIIELGPGELLSVNMTGASGTTATVWVI